MAQANRIDDLFRYIDTKNGDTSVCWPWEGPRGGRANDRGYFSFQGQRWLAYRLVYTMIKGDIPDGHVVRHKCDNSLCCNPEHLELGTQSDNEHDKYRRDRAGLPVMVVREIQRLLSSSQRLRQQDIAEIVSTRYKMSVSREAVRNIKLGLRRNQKDAMTTDEIHLSRVKVEEEKENP